MRRAFDNFTPIGEQVLISLVTFERIPDTHCGSVSPTLHIEEIVTVSGVMEQRRHDERCHIRELIPVKDVVVSIVHRLQIRHAHSVAKIAAVDFDGDGTIPVLLVLRCLLS